MERSCACEAPAVPDLQPGEGQISGAIEVEQKFLFGPSTIEKLAELGAILEGRVSFRDSYYDVPDWCLMREDHWLREREGVGWELKCPPDVGVVGSKETPCAAKTDNHPSDPVLRPPRDKRSSHAATQYREVTCPQDIVTRLCGLLDRVPGQNWTCVNKAVEELGLEVFASFVTTRHKYRVGDLHVDLDEADFGYAVGEVEAVVRQLEDVPEALEKIQKFCRQLGLEEKTAIPGKMSVYLHRFRPAHYKALTDGGWNCPESDKCNREAGWKSLTEQEPGWGERVSSPNYRIFQNYLYIKSNDL